MMLMHDESEKDKKKEVIVLDTDIISDDAQDDNIGVEVQQNIRSYNDIEIADVPFSIYEYLRQLSRSKIIIQPDFQRKQIWTLEQKSNFIESILLNYPLPPIYLNETREGKFNVIDGLQRTTSIEEFYNGKYSLKGIRVLTELSGMSFKELPENMQSKFEDKKLTVFVLKPSTPMAVIYDLFNRINTGGTQLNRQEVRNGIFVGKSTILLKKLSEQNYFKDAIGRGVSDARMKDREVVLRYLAFRWFDYVSNYDGDMSQYIENAMKSMNTFSDERLLEIENDFKRVMKLSYSIWGYNNFRIPTERTRGTINIAVLESVCCYLALRSDQYINDNKKTIKNNYVDLIHNDAYLDSVTRSTSNKYKVLTRFELADLILNSYTL